MPNQPPAEIKAVIDSALAGFNSKMRRSTTTASAAMSWSSMEWLRIAGQAQMPKADGSLMRKNGRMTWMSLAKPSRMTESLTLKSSARALMSLSQERSLSALRVSAEVALERSFSSWRSRAASGGSSHRLGVACPETKLRAVWLSGRGVALIDHS